MTEAVGAIGTDFGVKHRAVRAVLDARDVCAGKREARGKLLGRRGDVDEVLEPVIDNFHTLACAARELAEINVDRKSTRLNSSHEWISYAVFCLKKKKNTSTLYKVLS